MHSSGQASLAGCSELPGGQVAQGAVGTILIAVPTPAFDPFARIFEAQEPVLVQALGTHPPVERLDQPVIRGLLTRPPLIHSSWTVAASGTVIQGAPNAQRRTQLQPLLVQQGPA